jgi:2-hydroxychromene-2-carboxylate isomerase
LAWTWLRENHETISQSWHLFLRPVTLAPLIKANETKGPAEIPSKRNYLMKDTLRFASLHNIPFQSPPSLPFNSLYALRISLAECCGKDQIEVIDALYRAAWEEGKDLGSPEVVVDALNQKELPGEEWLERVGDKDLRKALKVQTKEAIEAGIFGLPSFLVDNEGERELFWGNDSISYLKLYLDDRDPLKMSPYKEQFKKFQDSYLEL